MQVELVHNLKRKVIKSASKERPKIIEIQKFDIFRENQAKMIEN